MYHLKLKSSVMFDVEEVDTVCRATVDTRQLAVSRSDRPLYPRCLEARRAAGRSDDGCRQLDVVEHLVERVTTSVLSTADVTATLCADVLEDWLNCVTICITCYAYHTPTSGLFRSTQHAYNNKQPMGSDAQLAAQPYKHIL